MEKPTRADMPIVHLAYGVCQMADERKEACIHCGDVWYAIKHKDGVCHMCQKKNLPGRTEINNHHVRNTLITAIASPVTILIGALLFFLLYK